MNFSIIIPTLNEGDNILSCLQSLKKQRHVYEVIIVDGGSTDNTLTIAKPLVDKILVSNQGRAIQMNTGAQNAKGHVLLFLHADTLLPDDALTILAALFNQKKDGWGRFNINLNGQHFMLKVIAHLMNLRSQITGIATGDQVIFINKSLFSSMDGYPEIALMEDIQLSSLLKKISRPHCIKAKVSSSGRRWEKNGIYKTILLMWSIRLRYFFGENPEVLCTLYSKGKLWKT